MLCGRARQKMDRPVQNQSCFWKLPKMKSSGNARNLFAIKNDWKSSRSVWLKQALKIKRQFKRTNSKRNTNRMFFQLLHHIRWLNYVWPPSPWKSNIKKDSLVASSVWVSKESQSLPFLQLGWSAMRKTSANRIPRTQIQFLILNSTAIISKYLKDNNYISLSAHWEVVLRAASQWKPKASSWLYDEFWKQHNPNH